MVGREIYLFNAGGKIVEIGNNYYGLDINDKYVSLFAFPFGLELISFTGLDVEIHITIFSIQFSFGFGLNKTLFRD